MSWSNPRTWTIGEVVTAANMNSFVSADLGVIPVATTISGLNSQYYGGAQTGGSMGLLRTTTTPYDFLAVTYDSTYAHWVSDQTVIIGGASPQGGWTANVWQTIGDYEVWSNATFNGTIIPYKCYTDAGLSLQVRASAVCKTDAGGHTMNIGCQLTPYAVAGAAGTSSTDTSLASTTSTSFVMIDSGWVNAPSITANTLAVVVMRAMNSATINSNAADVTHGTLAIRWVG